MRRHFRLSIAKYLVIILIVGPQCVKSTNDHSKLLVHSHPLRCCHLVVFPMIMLFDSPSDRITIPALNKAHKSSSCSPDGLKDVPLARESIDCSFSREPANSGCNKAGCNLACYAGCYHGGREDKVEDGNKTGFSRAVISPPLVLKLVETGCGGCAVCES